LLTSRGYQARIDFVSRKILQIPFARRRGNGPQQVLLLALFGSRAMSAIVPLLEDKRTSNAADPTINL